MEKYNIEISYDNFADNPISEYNTDIKYICQSNRYDLGNGTETDLELLKEAFNEAENFEQFRTIFKRKIEKYYSKKVIYIDFLRKYEHSSVKIYAGIPKGDSFDSSVIGFCIVFNDNKTLYRKKQAIKEAYIYEELERYTKFLNGEVFNFSITNDNGELIEGGGNVFNIEDIARYASPYIGSIDDIYKYLNY